MKALILAAGYGTRLYPLTKDKPKPLLEINGQPLINHLIQKLNKLELDEIIVVTNEKFFPKFKDWSANLDKSLDKKIAIINDGSKTIQDKRGAIGDINFVIEKESLNCDLLVIGGDNIFDKGLQDFLFFVKSHKSKACLGLFDIKDKKRAVHYGIVELDANQQVITFKEKPKVAKSSLVAMCLYYFPKNKLGLLSNYIKEVEHPDTSGQYIGWLCKREPVFGFVFTGHWFDIGHLHSLYQARNIFRSFKA